MITVYGENMRIRLNSVEEEIKKETRHDTCCSDEKDDDVQDDDEGRGMRNE